MEFYIRNKISILSLLLCFLHAISASKVPAMYVFGDSLADVGTNDYLKLTIIKANFAHNGVDFLDGKATGRFSNGKNAVDFLAEKLGIPSPPPYLSVSKSSNKTQMFLNGINFASGGAGVLKSTYFGLCISFDKQIEQLAELKEYLVQQLGSEQAQSHLSKSVFSLIIGSNDIIGYIGFSLGKSPEKLVNEMSAALQRQLKLMYDTGARKFAFVGTMPVGCCPTLRVKNRTEDCNAKANYISELFATESAYILNQMKSERSDMNYSFFNGSAILTKLIDNPQNYGFTETKAACCGIGKLKAKVACYPISKLCSNRSDHVFWDSYHPTERTSKLLIDAYYEGSSPYAYPMNLKELGEL